MEHFKIILSNHAQAECTRRNATNECKAYWDINGFKKKPNEPTEITFTYTLPGSWQANVVFEFISRQMKGL